MAKRTERQGQRQGRRGTPAKPRLADRRPPTKGHVETTLGELIAAAFDTVGNEVRDVARLLSSRELRRCAGNRIVLVQ